MAGGRRRSGIIFIVLALVLILILAVAGLLLRDQILNQFFPQQPVATAPDESPQQNQGQPSNVNTVGIIVLAQPLTRGTVITEGVITRVDYPQNALVEGLFFTDPQQVINKVARFDLGQGTPLTPSLIMDPATGSYAATRIPRGMVAISVPITRLTSNAYSLLPGDHVNIIASLLLVDIDPQFQTRLPNSIASILAPGPTSEGGPTTQSVTIQPVPGAVQGRAELDQTLNSAFYVLPSESQRPRLVSQTLIQDSVVLWMGNFPESGLITEGPLPTATPVAEGQTATPVVRPDIISLIVNPQDAVTLNYLMLSGAKLNMVLRAAGDDQRITTEAVTLQFILDQYAIPNPAKLPYGMEPTFNNDPNTNDLLDYPTLP